MLSEMPRRGEILLRPPDGDAEVRKIAERHLAPLSACALGCAQDGRCSLPCVYGKRLLIDPQTILSSYSSFGSAPNPPRLCRCCCTRRRCNDRLGTNKNPLRGALSPKRAGACAYQNPEAGDAR